MTQQNHHPRILLYTTLASLAAAGMLVPRGEGWAHLIYQAALLALAAGVAAYAYARDAAAPATRTDKTLHPAIDWQVIEGDRVPESLLEGAAPLVAIVRDGEVPHPDFAATLAPYFADPALAFVQGATRYDGAGGVADSYRQLTAIADEVACARERVSATALRGSGALISRETLRDAWRPGDTWETLGMRMQALGYAGRFEKDAVVLAWAPLTLTQYGERLWTRTESAVRTLALSIIMRGLPLEARVQYAAGAFVPLAAWLALLCAGVSTLMLIVRDAGPVILTSPAALPMVAISLGLIGAALWAWQKLTALNPARPMALMLVGAASFAGERVRAAVTGPEAKRAWEFVRDGARATGAGIAAAAATVRAGGNGDTAPAGTPAHS